MHFDASRPPQIQENRPQRGGVETVFIDVFVSSKAIEYSHSDTAYRIDTLISKPDKEKGV